MRALTELYIQQFKTTLAMMFQYRAALIIWTIGHILEPLVYLIVWSIVSESSGGTIGAFSTREFAGYFLVLMLVNHFTYTWIMHEFEYRIRTGFLSFALLKPVHPIHSDIADNVTAKMITLPVMVCIAAVLYIAFQAAIVPQPWGLFGFFPALILSFFIRFILEWTLAQAAFWTTRISAINQSYFVLLLFLSGQIAPLALLPPLVQVIAKVLPFYWMIGFPVELLLGKLSLSETLIGFGVQIIWLGVSIVLIRFMWRRSVKIYSAVGA